MPVFLKNLQDLQTSSLIGRIITATNSTQDILTLKNAAGVAVYIFSIDANSAWFRIRTTGGANIFTVDAAGYLTWQGTSTLLGTNTADFSAKLLIESTTRGFVLPRMTSAQKIAINAGAITAGCMVYDTTLNKLCVYTGAAWETVTSV